jgi:energy-coupling factor transporter ATP-binding protein EcfA2
MANKPPLKLLRIKGFRGSTQDFSIDFDSKKPLALIYGENGSGKTTICDAFDFLGNRKVGSLENRGLGQLHPFWASVGTAGGIVAVELTVDGTTWKAQASSKNVLITPDKPGAPKIEVLRRASILRLVQYAPKDRYEALGPFIDIGLVEQAESALKSQIKETRTARSEAANRIAENRETVERLWKEAGSQGQAAMAWAQEEIATAPEDATSHIQALRETVRAIEALIALKDLASIANDELEQAETQSSDGQSAMQQIESDCESSDAVLIKVLTAARDHFNVHGLGSVCPLCQSGEKVADLVERVNARLETLAKLSHARGVVELAVTKLEAKKSAVSNVQQRAKAAAATTTDRITKAPKQWLDETAGNTSSVATVQTSGDLSDLDVAALELARERATQLGAALAAKSSWYKSVKTVYEQYELNVGKESFISKVLPKLEQALSICEAQRKSFLNAILSAIAKEVGRLYELVHPGEGLNKIILKLDPKRPGSLDLAANFLSKLEQPPHAYFSESHLDSLGLCMFLALAAHESPANTIVVMDDVLGSIDEPHVDRLIQMLYAESGKFKHTIITTHYQPWREKFRWGWLKNGQCQLIELGSWSSAGGIRTTDLTRAPLVELRQHLSQTPPSLQAACASAGVLLEAVCDYLTSRYECDVPRRKGKLTLGDLLPKIGGKLKANLRVEVKQADGSYQSVALTSFFDQLQQMAQIRNIFGCHYNDLSMQLPDGDALKFASLVRDLASALICDDEGWPGSDKSGSYWATRGETRRLHPLQKPK